MWGRWQWGSTQQQYIGAAVICLVGVDSTTHTHTTFSSSKDRSNISPLMMGPFYQASMTKNAMEDMTSCLHYSDDWEFMGDGDWDDIYDDPQVLANPSTASHRLKHGMLEDGYIIRYVV